MPSSEQSAYLPVSGEHLYTVLHGAEDPLARVLLIGPFAAERHYSYIPWVAWSRYLAERRIECLRYDYRGVGESTGLFKEMSFDHWIEDVAILTAWLKSRTPAIPVILHGLDMGALLAAKAFENGGADGLLMWAPPATANLALRATLLRSIAQENLFKPRTERKPLADYLKPLENGEFLEVDGYQWSAKLWSDSFRFELPKSLAGEDGSTDRRPVRTVKLDGKSAPLVKGTAVGYEAIHKDFGPLFADNFEWLAKQVELQSTQGPRIGC